MSDEEPETLECGSCGTITSHGGTLEHGGVVLGFMCTPCWHSFWEPEAS